MNSIIERKTQLTSATTNFTVSLAAGEIKYFECAFPTDTSYTWLLVSINTLTAGLEVNDLSNAGFRIRNNSGASATRNVMLCWIGWRN